VKRSLAIFGALALAAAQPAITLAAPRAGVALSRPAAPAPHAAARGGPASQGDFKVPFDVDPQLKPLSVSQRFTIQSSAGSNLRAPLSLHPWYGWQSSPGHPWYPALYGPGCNANNNYLRSPSEQQPADLSIGSLVDGKSNLLSPSHDAGLAAGNHAGAASSSSLKLQAGFYPTACGASFSNL